MNFYSNKSINIISLIITILIYLFLTLYIPKVCITIKEYIYYDDDLNVAVEEFIFIVDFKESGIQENKLANTLMLEMRDAGDESLYTVLGIQHANNL